MLRIIKPCRSGTRGAALLWGGLAVVICLSGAPQAALAQGPLVVTRDNGGLLKVRRSEVRALQASGRRVELRGICYSACTMYLGAPGVCLDPQAELGFHGPSWYSAPLPQQDFDYWSHELAVHYREPLRSWFMNKARYTLSSYHRVSGAEMIRMGYPQC
ncbi:hypothetical protein [Falsigemmobacter faecalis]|uniref:Uncharacterized protein n=1 Tax=Falsigemmobacter faecalis TaxID=2488730 RepID=A0A3P3DVD7_9RHOB|nr:hypothetical protein [Falsigemmobacter faecalis]RRH78233.1 hypothetical protein EG244_01965 [Falsigemmobacter faecalis]